MDHERDAECGPMLDFHAVVHVITSAKWTADGARENGDCRGVCIVCSRRLVNDSCRIPCPGDETVRLDHCLLGHEF